ncbi:MAG: glycosyltransferase 87 family protein [Acidobacteria bacterium]|nr:glycosyltransferase 87 family protein [Acidobacteriota bacterium]
MIARIPTALALGLLAALLEAALLVLRRLHPFDEHVVEVVSVGLAASVVYLVAAWLAVALQQSTRPAIAIILLAAVLFRLTLFDLPPSLSDDLYRYQWEGQLQLAGQNPYLVASEAGPRLPAAGYTTAYGPLTQLLFWLTALVDGGVLSFKLLSLLFDLGSLLAVLMLLRARGLPAERALVYAWCPLVVVEFAGSGHNDSITVFGILLACWLVVRNHAVLSALPLAAAVLTKWFPALLLPVFFRRAGWRGLGAFVATVAIGLLPYLDAGRNLVAGVRSYAESWRNNASLFDSLRGATGSDTAAAFMAALLLVGLAVYLAAKRAEPLRSAYILITALLFLSPSVFPWYLTWLVPFLCFFPNTGLLLWTATIFLSYHVLIGYRALGTWQYDPTLVWLEYAPVFALLAVSWFSARRRA